MQLHPAQIREARKRPRRYLRFGHRCDPVNAAAAWWAKSLNALSTYIDMSTSPNYNRAYVAIWRGSRDEQMEAS
jgi:hypothetical protein